MKQNRVFLLLPLLLACTFIKAQHVALKTNLLYGAVSYTPNLGMEVAVGKHSTIDLGVGYNPWNLNGTENDNKKTVHLLGELEYRYWLCNRFAGHFVGIHALGTQFNISEHELPLLFGKGSENFRYQGFGYGGGISYGYQFYLSQRWNLEANLGVGYVRMEYDKYDCKTCGSKVGPEKRNYFGPTKAGISLIYIIK